MRSRKHERLVVEDATVSDTVFVVWPGLCKLWMRAGGGKERIVLNMVSQIRIVSTSVVIAFDRNVDAVLMYAGEGFQVDMR